MRLGERLELRGAPVRQATGCVCGEGKQALLHGGSEGQACCGAVCDGTCSLLWIQMPVDLLVLRLRLRLRLWACMSVLVLLQVPVPASSTSMPVAQKHLGMGQACMCLRAAVAGSFPRRARAAGGLGPLCVLPPSLSRDAQAHPLCRELVAFAEAIRSGSAFCHPVNLLHGESQKAARVDFPSRGLAAPLRRPALGNAAMKLWVESRRWP